MKHIGIREFKDHATGYLASGETLVIERHGDPIGFYVPIEAKDRVAGAAALGRFGKLVDDLLVATGIDEDQLVAEFALRPTRKRR